MNPEGFIIHLAVNVSLADESITKVITRAIFSWSEDYGNATTIQNGNHIPSLGQRWSEANELVVVRAAILGRSTTDRIASGERSVPCDGAYATEVVVH